MLTAQDIQSQQFHVRFRGFDVEEVDDFLERVAESVLALSEENKKLRERQDELERELATFQNQQKTFQNAILSAQHIAEEMQEKTRQELEKQRARAQAEAEELVADARQEVVNLERELDRLKSLKAQAAAELRAVLESYAGRLDRDFGGSRPPASPRAAAVAPEPPPESDLYERIEVDESFFSGSAPAAAGPELPVADLFGLDDDVETRAVPDLDGDMVFTLEDPLDRPEPSITLESEDERPRSR
ncbi:MAG: DivIVA domain-containing protein [Thermodesulfobacteriota bacterium]